MRAGAGDERGGPRRVAQLEHRLGQAQFGLGLRDLGVDHEPGLVESQIFQLEASALADDAVGAVAADHVRSANTSLAAVAGVPHSELDDVFALLQSDRLVLEEDVDAVVASGASAQLGLEGGLVEDVVGPPALARDLLAQLEAKQQLVVRVAELVIGGHRGVGENLLRQAHGLEDAHDLVVEMQGPRQAVDLAVALEDRRANAFSAQQVCQQGAHGAVTHDQHVVSRVGSGRCVAHARPPRGRLRPALITCIKHLFDRVNRDQREIAEGPEHGASEGNPG